MIETYFRRKVLFNLLVKVSDIVLTCTCSRKLTPLHSLTFNSRVSWLFGGIGLYAHTKFRSAPEIRNSMISLLLLVSLFLILRRGIVDKCTICYFHSSIKFLHLEGWTIFGIIGIKSGARVAKAISWNQFIVITAMQSGLYVAEIVMDRIASSRLT